MAQSPDKPPTYRVQSPTDRDASWSPDSDAIPLVDDDSSVLNPSTPPIYAPEVHVPNSELAAAVLDEEPDLARPSQPSFGQEDLEDAVSLSSELSPCPSELDELPVSPSQTFKPVNVEVPCIHDVWGPIKWHCARATCAHSGRKAKSKASQKIAAYSELRRDWEAQKAQDWDALGQEMPKEKQQGQLSLLAWRMVGSSVMVASYSNPTSRRRRNWPPLPSKDSSSNSRSSSVDTWPRCGTPIDMAQLRAQWTRERQEWDEQDRLRCAKRRAGMLDVPARAAYEGVTQAAYTWWWALQAEEIERHMISTPRSRRQKSGLGIHSLVHARYGYNLLEYCKEHYLQLFWLSNFNMYAKAIHLKLYIGTKKLFLRFAQRDVSVVLPKPQIQKEKQNYML